ncbi:MAG: DotG/IcmE/VirB10 family protein, partial [Legionellales bacterium]|nr:DotG/IcmE/VirB10 family protein [Legionellales bacterium]
AGGAGNGLGANGQGAGGAGNGLGANGQGAGGAGNGLGANGQGAGGAGNGLGANGQGAGGAGNALGANGQGAGGAGNGLGANGQGAGGAGNGLGANGQGAGGAGNGLGANGQGAGGAGNGLGANGQGAGGAGNGLGANGQGAGGAGNGLGANGQGNNNLGNFGNGSNLNNANFDNPGDSNDADSASNFRINLAKLHERQMRQLSQEQLQRQEEAMQAAMSSQAGKLFSAWLPPPTQEYVETAPEQTQAQKSELATALGEGSGQLSGGGAGGATLGAGIPKTPPPFIRAGSVFFATMITSVDSDFSGPVMARVVSGPYAGAKLIGSFQPVTTQLDDKLTLTFNTMVVKSYPHSISVNAFAIDPKTARTALATSVDHHYLMRYGTLFASAFLEGYANALTSSGSTSTIQPSGTQTFTFPQLNTRQQIAVGLGTVGNRYSSILQSNFTINPTVYIASGTSVGILFVSDVSQPTS